MTRIQELIQQTKDVCEHHTAGLINDMEFIEKIADLDDSMNVAACRLND
jgi:hypothetical protein